LAKYAFGNMSIRLVGLITPLSFKLRASSGQVYYRYDAHVPKLGPKAAAPLIDHGNDLVAGDAMLMNILDGMPPISSTRLNVVGVDAQTAAWRIGSKVYLRTPYMLLSPGWDGSVGSGDGTHVYEIPDTPVLLLSDNGNLIHARIGNNAKLDEQPVPAIEDGMAHPLRPSAAVQATDSLISTQPSTDQSNIDSSSPIQAPSRTLIRPVQVGGNLAPSTNALSPSSNALRQTAPTAQAGAQTQGTQQ
jgi:intracellular multiplication protein IcmK